MKKAGRERLTEVLVSWKPGVIALEADLDKGMLLILLIDLCVYLTDCFLGLDFSVAEMAAVGLLITEDLMDMQLPELTAQFVGHRAEEQEMLVVQKAERKEE